MLRSSVIDVLCTFQSGYWPAGCMERAAHHNDALQELPGLVNGGVGIKAGAAGGKLVMQDGLQLLRQAVSLLLQLGLLLLRGQSILLQLLVVSANHPAPFSASVLKRVNLSRSDLSTGWRLLVCEATTAAPSSVS